jgi:hypothetical protein
MHLEAFVPLDIHTKIKSISLNLSLVIRDRVRYHVRDLGHRCEDIGALGACAGRWNGFAVVACRV